MTYGFGNWKQIVSDKKIWYFSDDDFAKNNECWMLLFRKLDQNPNRDISKINQNLA